MTTQESKPEHLFVKNPFSGKLVNVLPLFELMNARAMSDIGPEDLWLQIQEVHDFISTTPPRDDEGDINLTSWAAVNFTLVRMRKTFQRMQEVTA